MNAATESGARRSGGLPLSGPASAGPRLAALLDAAGAGVLVLDSQYRLVAANATAARLAGGGRGSLRGKSAFDLFPAFRSPEVQSVVWQVQTGRTLGTPDFAHRPPGARAVVWLTAWGVPLADSLGHPTGMLLLMRDVTAYVAGRRRAEQRCDVLASAPLVAVEGVDRHGLVRSWSETAAAWYGRRPSEALGKPLADLILDRAEARRFRRGLAQVVARGLAGPVEHWSPRASDGSRRRTAAQLLPVGGAGPLGEFLRMEVDLTRHAGQFEQELADLREKLDRVYESSPAGMVLTTGADRRVAEVNASFLSLVGAGRREVLRKPLAALGLALGGATVGAAADGVRVPKELSLQPRRGELRQVLVSEEPVQWGREGGILHFVVDVTAQRRLEVELRESQKLEAIGHLARGVAHDLNNILTVIQGHQSLIARELKLPPRATESLAHIAEAAARAANLTRQLLTFSRKQPLEPRLLDVNGLVASVARMLRRTLGEDITLKVLSSARPCWVMADLGMLEQVVLNLALNARDAMPQGGTLMLATRPVAVPRPPMVRQPHAVAGAHVCLVVEDTGEGIPAELLPRIFEPFFTTKPTGRGTGLGLAVVHGVVQEHRGWIDVRSRQGRGSVFRVYLPMARPPSRVEPAATAPVSLPPGEETLLLVEDEAAVRELAASVLSQCGYRVLVAASGRAGLRLWRQHRHAIRLLVTDVVMPGGIDGKELARRLQADRPDLPVILTTGYGPGVAEDRRRSPLRFHLVEKPYTAESLAGAVRAVLEETSEVIRSGDRGAADGRKLEDHPRRAGVRRRAGSRRS